MKATAVFLTVSVLVAVSAGCAKSSGGTTSHLLKQPQEKSKTVAADNAPFIAGKRNKVYHARHCPYAANLEAPIGFPSARDAVAKGYMPCEFCNPSDYPKSADQPSEK